MNKKNIVLFTLTCGVGCQDAGAGWVYQGARVTNNIIPLMAQRIVNQEKKPRKPGQPPSGWSNFLRLATPPSPRHG